MSSVINPSGSFDISGGGHVLTRLNATTMYAVFQDAVSVGSGISIYKTSDDGENWSVAQTLAPTTDGNDTYNSYLAPSCCIDSEGIVRIAYMHRRLNTVLGNSVDARYVELDTSDDSLQNDVIAQNESASITGFGTDCAIANGDFQMVYRGYASGRFGAFSTLKYTTTPDRGSSWTTLRTISYSLRNLYSPCIMIEGQATERPIIVAAAWSPFQKPSATSIHGSLGNASVATSFTNDTNLVTAYTSNAPDASNAPFIFQDFFGAQRVAVTGKINSDSFTNEHPTLLKHNYGDAWGTWTEQGFGTDKAYANTVGFARSNGAGDSGSHPDINIIAPDTSGNLERKENFNKAPGTNTYSATSSSVSPTPSSIKVRWANHWEPAMDRIDYVYLNSGDIYYDRIDLNISG